MELFNWVLALFLILIFNQQTKKVSAQRPNFKVISASTEKNSCRESWSKEICNGHGRCDEVNGRCICVGNYTGQFCGNCSICKEDDETSCEKYRDCVHCLVFHDIIDNCEEICESLQPQPSIRIVDDLTKTRSMTKDADSFCTFLDYADCRFYFSYEANSPNEPPAVIQAQATKDCPPSPPVFWIFSGVAGSLILILLLFLLLWLVVNCRRGRGRSRGQEENEDCTT